MRRHQADHQMRASSIGALVGGWCRKIDENLRRGSNYSVSAWIRCCGCVAAIVHRSTRPASRGMAPSRKGKAQALHMRVDTITAVRPTQWKLQMRVKDGKIRFTNDIDSAWDERLLRDTGGEIVQRTDAPSF